MKTMEIKINVRIVNTKSFNVFSMIVISSNSNEYIFYSDIIVSFFVFLDLILSTLKEGYGYSTNNKRHSRSYIHNNGNGNGLFVLHSFFLPKASFS